jgi:hypothetical protein
MRLLACALASLTLILGSSVSTLAKCGKDPADLAAVVATEATAAAQCNCCTTPAGSAQRACARAVAKAAAASGSLPEGCVGRVVRDRARACPLTPANTPCKVCKTNSDCQSDQFCECPVGTCGSVDGVCVTKPQACPELFIGVCGCDGKTYPNDCQREAAGVCKAHDGFCAGQCGSDADCNDGNPCTVDHCVNGVCEHACVCADAAGNPTCCPGPADLCAKPCGANANGVCGGVCPQANETCTDNGGSCACMPSMPLCGDSSPTCGGSCPSGAACQASATAATGCSCVSGPGGPCGGFVYPPPPICAPGLVCKQSNPDVPGVCEPPSCIPLSGTGCTQTSDCCEPCGNGRIAPCAVCLNAQCVGAP